MSDGASVNRRLIFTLLYDSGHFMLSRNFRLQQVGDIGWLERNYDFRVTATSIDELIVLDVSRSPHDRDEFRRHVERLNDDCFVPIAAGGGIRSISDAHDLLRSGADKVVVNTALHRDPGLIERLATEYGAQCIVASVDAKRIDDDVVAMIDNGGEVVPGGLSRHLAAVADLPVGEIYLTSMDRDGTGQGFDLELLSHVPAGLPMPLILAGGAGKPEHFVEGLRAAEVDAVATAHLFNFIGDALERSREHAISNEVDLPRWDRDLLRGLADSVRRA